MNDHVIDLAELYALGALEADDLRRLEAHITTCPDCRIAIGRAEATVAALDEAFLPLDVVPSSLEGRIARAARDVVPLSRDATTNSQSMRALPAPRARTLASAAAVALAFTSLTAGFASHDAGLRAAVTRNDVALAAIVHSHFNHVQFVPRTRSAPAAKVLYGRNGEWAYVVVDSTSCACRVELVRNGRQIDLGSPQAAAGAVNATVFTSDAERPSRVELVTNSGQLLADAMLMYAR